MGTDLCLLGGSYASGMSNYFEVEVEVKNMKNVGKEATTVLR